MNVSIPRRSIIRRLAAAGLALISGRPAWVRAGSSHPPATPRPPVFPPGRTTTVTIAWSDNAAGRQWAEDLRGWLSSGMPMMGTQVGGESHPVASCYWSHSPETKP